MCCFTQSVKFKSNWIKMWSGRLCRKSLRHEITEHQPSFTIQLSHSWQICIVVYVSHKWPDSHLFYHFTASWWRWMTNLSFLSCVPVRFELSLAELVWHSGSWTYKLPTSNRKQFVFLCKCSITLLAGHFRKDPHVPYVTLHYIFHTLWAFWQSLLCICVHAIKLHSAPL